MAYFWGIPDPSALQAGQPSCYEHEPSNYDISGPASSAVLASGTEILFTTVWA